MGFEDEAESYYFEQCLNPVINEYRYGKELCFEKIYKKRPKGGGKRRDVRFFSPASARRYRAALRRRGCELTHFVTITFPPEIFYCKGGFKPYVRYFWQTLGKQLRDRAIPYIWAREPQRNGRPHYHVMCTHGQQVRLLAARINRRFLTAKRADQNLRVGIQSKLMYGQRGAERYMAKLASYCTKEANRVHDTGWRHWARNFRDHVVECYEASHHACDWLRRNYDRFYAFKFPLVISIPMELKTGPPLTC